MKKGIMLAAVAGFMLMSCGNKMTPQEEELVQITNDIKTYQEKQILLLRRANHISDSIVVYIQTANPEVSLGEALLIADNDFDIRMLEAEYRSYGKIIDDKKEEQQRLALVVSALKQ